MIVGAEPAVIASLGVVVTFVGALAGAWASVRLVKPRQKQLVASAGLDDAKRWDSLMARYETVVRSQDEQLTGCHSRIDELEAAEQACEQRNREHAVRIDQLEKVIRRAGLNGG